MKKKLIIGPRIKRLRAQLGLTQAEFARRLDVSATYVNLIESNQRPVSAAVLLKLAEQFDVNVAELAQDMDAGLVNELVSALRDPVFGGVQAAKSELEDLVGASPETIKAFLRLHERYRELALSTYSDANPLADREKVELLEESARPVETVRQFLHEQNNYFPELDETASEVYTNLTAGGKAIEVAIQERLEPLFLLLRSASDLEYLHVPCIGCVAVHAFGREGILAELSSDIGIIEIGQAGAVFGLRQEEIPQP